MSSKIAALLVDPDALMLTIFQRLGRGLGLDVTYAPDVATARHHLSERDFHIAFLELHLPDFLTGHAFLVSLRERVPTMPIAVVSGTPDPEEAAAAIRAGAIGRLNKPFGTTELEELIAQVSPTKHKQTAMRHDAPDHGDLAALPSSVRRYAERFASRRATAILAARYDRATNGDIATRLGISETTVKRTLKSTFFDPLDARFADLESAAAKWLERRHGTAESPKARH